MVSLCGYAYASVDLKNSFGDNAAHLPFKCCVIGARWYRFRTNDKENVHSGETALANLGEDLGSVPTWWLTSISNSSPRGPDVLSGL